MFQHRESGYSVKGNGMFKIKTNKKGEGLWNNLDDLNSSTLQTFKNQFKCMTLEKYQANKGYICFLQHRYD